MEDSSTPNLSTPALWLDGWIRQAHWWRECEALRLAGCIEDDPPTEEPANWYVRHGCTHAHCPLGCDKPQPEPTITGGLVCMRCMVEGGVMTEMVPCVPETCEGDE